MLKGLDDVPAIAQDKCYFCPNTVMPDCWFVFIKSGIQMYLVPICDECDKKRSQTTEKGNG